MIPGLADPDALATLVIHGSTLAADLSGSVNQATVAFPIDSAPTFTITIRDEQRRWSRSPLFKEQVTADFAGVQWLLASIRRANGVLELVFEHAVVAMLRHHIGVKVVVPGTMTRIGFAKELVGEEPWIEVVVPFAAVNEPISSVAMSRGNVNLAALSGQDISVQGPDAANGDQTGAPSTDQGAATSDTGTQGQQAQGLAGLLQQTAQGGQTGGLGTLFAPPGQVPGDVPAGAGAAATAGGTQADQPLPSSGQMTSTQAAEAAAQAGFSGQPLAIIVAIGHAESGLIVDRVSKPNSNGTVDRGWLQINSIHTQYDPDRLTSDPVYCAKAAWDISGHGNMVDTGDSFYQWSTYDSDGKHPYNNGSYRQYLSDAQVAADAAASTATSDTTTGMSASGSEAQQKPENTWDALRRIFDEILWRCFVRGVNELWITPDWALYPTGPTFVAISVVAIQGDPSLPAPGSWVMSLTEDSPGVDWIDWEWDVNLRTATVTVALRTALWNIWSGQAVAFPDIGPASGTWLVSNVEQTVGEPAATVTCIQPQPSLPELTQVAGQADLGTTSDALAGGLGATATSTDAGKGLDFIWPVHGPITQDYGQNGHPGIDIGVPTGTPVFATADATVRNVATGFVDDEHATGSQKPLEGYGNCIFLAHAGGIGSIYGHLHSVGVAVGDKVTQGQQIGVSNNTGWSSGAHLHFEMRTGVSPAALGGHVSPHNYVKGTP